MNQQEENNIIILRYIKGELGDEELRTFEQRMANDPEFAKEVAFAKEYHAFQERKEFEEALKTFNQEKKEEGFFEKIEQQIDQETQKTPTKARKSITKWLYPLAAAAILIGLVLAWLLLGQTGLETSEKIIAEVSPISENFVDERAGSGFSGKDSIPIEILKIAVRAYGNGEYKAAAKAFETCLKSAKTDTDIEFYLAKSYLLMQPSQTDKAISILENLSQGEGQEERTILHLGAAYIRRGKYDKAIQFLKQEQINATDYLKKLDNLIKEAKQKKQ